MNDAPNGPRDSLVTAILRASDASLQMGFPPRPQIHVFDSSRIEECEGYGGFVECRPYNRGLDASAAIIDLGIIAFALGSTQILMVWEESDLRRSVTGIDSNKHPTGLGLVHATRTDTTLYWTHSAPATERSPVLLHRSSGSRPRRMQSDNCRVDLSCSRPQSKCTQV